ncbi:MAG: NAD-dependent epimerase/dehydratase family protein [Candidatus Omnitrophota bacterium]|jgi:CDP-paratose 2-epimerase|nr:MAG: NAD-dependent epimerase/dehydratase family protein [Candidatus Omnitrophota bacterium]
MRVLVTGGAGLVGSHCAEFFSKQNSKNKVIVLDNLMRSKIFGYDKNSVEFNWKYLQQFKNIELIKGDVRDEKDVAKAIGKGVDVVIHTAGQPGVPSSVRMPKEDFSINAFGTLNVLEAARAKSKDTVIVYCSTNKTFGENVDKIALIEKEKRYIYDGVVGVNESMSTDLTGHTPYGVSKLVGDLYVQEYSHIYKMKTAVFRMSCTYGTRQFGFEDQGWVAWFIIAALFNKPITIYGNGKQVRDMLYVDDLVDAFNKFINSDLERGLFNIGGGPDNTISLLEFLDQLESATGKRPKTEFSDWRPSDQKVYITDTAKVKKELKWDTKVSVKSGINKLIDWVKDNESYFS